MATSIDKGAVVAELRETWASLAELGDQLAAGDWDLPTACPGWSVRDQFSHVIGTELMLLGRRPPEVDAGDAPHVRNDIGRANEPWIVARRTVAPTELVAELRAVTAERLAALDAMTQAEFDADSWTPAGPGTYGRFMQIRVFDSWMHEQDVREAVGRPGHLTGPAAERSVDEVERAIGYLVGKRAGAPEGSSVTIRLTGPVERTMHVVVEARARAVAALDGPATATVTLPSDLFLRLAGGRRSADEALAEGTVTLAGDLVLAERVARNLAFTI